MDALRQRLRGIGAIFNPLSILLHYTQLPVCHDRAQSKIPVLMYHKIVEGRAKCAGTNYYVNEATFYEQMSFLYENEYRALTLDEYVDCLRNRTPWPRKSLLITFDDGYSNMFKLGYPVLKTFGLPAAVFVSPEYIGTRKPFPGDRQYVGTDKYLAPHLLPLSWDEIRMMGDIVSIGSHTMSHVLPGHLPPDSMHYELSESKRIIERETGRPVAGFAYPGGLRQHGAFSLRSRQALIDAGYKVAFNSEIGTNGSWSDPYVQRRLTVEAGDSLELFRAKLAGAYDWVRIAQWCFHTIFKLKKHPPAERSLEPLKRTGEPVDGS
jgi:peptidoglycan/xylan/chitin deacetylase (PgdA/CDA1 family)